MGSATLTRRWRWLPAVEVRHEGRPAEIAPGGADGVTVGIGNVGAREMGWHPLLGEGAVAVVAEELARIDRAAFGHGFVANEHIKPAVAVVIKPRGVLRRVVAEHAGLHRDIGKRIVAVVTQQGIGNAAFLAAPGAAQDEHVDEAVVVVVPVDHVESAGETEHSGRFGALGEGAATIVGEVTQLAVGPPSGSHDVKVSVEVEVVHHQPTR